LTKYTGERSKGEKDKMEYKTVEQAREELKEIDPRLLEKYRIREVDNKNGVQLLRGDVANVISIVSRGTPCKSYGADDGLYEICIPRKDHKALESIVGKISDDVVGHLTLPEAVEIAEAVISARSEK